MKHLASMRDTIDFLTTQNELVRVREEVDPIYEIAGIQKALEEGPAFFFENL